MQFLYDKRAGSEILELNNEPFLHLKARRVSVGERINIRNLKDGKNYLYEVREFGRKSATLSLEFASLGERVSYDLVMAWAVIDPKTIEKTLPFLNELGVGKIIFVYTQFSQANFRLDLARFEHICALSCEQCGRDSLMEFEIYQNIDEFASVYDNVALVNFGGKSLDVYVNELLFVGPEGGFSDTEKARFKSHYGLKTNDILRSQTAIVAVAAKFAL